MAGVTREDNTQAALVELRAQLQAVLEETGKGTVDQASANTPPRYKSGDLMDGFYWEWIGPLEIAVSNVRPYFGYQELGTVHIAGWFMLTRAVDQKKPEFLAAVQKVVNP